MIGQTVGPYHVVEKIGEGGMGEVYRARDAKLHRHVALKILPAKFVLDADRRMRFEREARMLASLNHPHIAQIYGVEDHEGVSALVLELVDGPTLADRLRGGALSPIEAVTIARQIAEALDSAHEKGIVHRDLKPANIKIAAGGMVKVLDFGLAKAWAPEAGPPDGSSDALTVAGTELGAILGTPAYMSPEQARGLAVDRRTDIWALGCVLFEMLTGRTPFAGATSSDTIAAIIGREPDWRTLPAGTPPHMRQLARRCLEKDPKRRLRDIGEAVYELRPDRGADPAVSPDASHRTSPRTWARRVAGAALAAVVLTTAAFWQFGSRRMPEGNLSGVTTPVRFSIAPPAGFGFGSAISDFETTYMAFSPDGSTLAFIAIGRTSPSQVWIRSLSSDEAHVVAGTENAVSVFWSPDGRSIGFFADDTLKRTDLSGGIPVPLCDVPVGVGLFGTWGRNDEILFASVQGDGIFSIPASGAGGRARTVIERDVAATPDRVLWPWFLPDGRRFIYTALHADGTGHVMLGEMDGSHRQILSAGSNVQWVDPGWLLYVREGTLLAQRVDPDSVEPAGQPFSIAAPVSYTMTTGRAMFSTSRNGMVALQSSLDRSRLVWFDRSGRERETVGTTVGTNDLRLSPDGRRVLFSRMSPSLGTYDIWTIDLDRQIEERLTTSPWLEVGGTWLPDGQAIVFTASASGAPPSLAHKNLTTGAERPLRPASRLQFPTDVSPDGDTLVYQQRTDLGNWDVMALSLTDPSSVVPLFASPFSEMQMQVAPHGRAAAFTSDESGRFEVYVAPFPVTGAKTVVSTGGGASPRWRRDGRELFYLWGGRLMAVPIGPSGYTQIGRPTPLFALEQGSPFDVSADGQRFVAAVPEVIARTQPLTVILNWPAGINR